MSELKVAISLALVGLLSFAAPGAARAATDGGDEEATSATDPEAEATPTEAPSEEGSAVVKQTNKRKWGVGARLRYVFVPQAMLNLFLDHSTSMNSVGIGAEVVGRKGDSDIVFGLEYDGASPENGLYQDKGDDPGLCNSGNGDQGKCPDYTRFDGLGMIGLDASFIWHANLSSKVQLRYGGGLGIGIVTGAMYKTKMKCATGTTLGDLDDPNACGDPKTNFVTPEEKSDDVPPVVPIINALFGARFLVSDNLAVNVETGFRDVFYLGMGADWIF
jgi:hypothetical protein